MHIWTSQYFLMDAKLIKLESLKDAHRIDVIIDIITEASGTNPIVEICQAFGLTHNIIEKRFALGDICFVARDRQKYLGILWGHTGRCYIEGAGKKLDLHEREVYLYGVFVLPEARRRQIFKNMMTKFYQYYTARCASGFFALVAPHNLIMQNTLKKLGFAGATKLFYIRVGNIRILHTFHVDSNKRTIKVFNKAPLGYPII